MQPIDVVIVSFYKIHRLKACINSVNMCLDYNADRLIIVDNSIGRAIKHTNAIRKYIAGVERQNNHVTTRMNPGNHRFTTGTNEGISLGTNPYIFLVNNDTEVVDALTFMSMVEFMEKHPDVATLTPVTVHSNGNVYCSGAHGSGAHYRDIITAPRNAEWNNFAFVCIRRNTIEKIGMLEVGHIALNGRKVLCEHFHSDEEWCRRATKAGYKHMVHPIIVRHYHREG